MKLLFIATNPQAPRTAQNRPNFQTGESSSRELIERINTDLDDLFMMYDKYYGKQELPKCLESSSPANHQYAIVNAKEDYFSYLCEDDVAGEDDKEVASYLSEKLGCASIEEFHRSQRKRFSILYQITRHPKTIIAMYAPAESFFSIFGSVITKPRHRERSYDKNQAL